ncbi:MAG: MerR family transcriptional regulator [Holdemania massiliensis]
MDEQRKEISMKNRIRADQEKTRNFHQYTVGEMASLLSMSAPTIRFYDSQGAVVPHRDQENQYRRYTVVDGNYLIKMKELKNIGASLQESVQLLNNVDFKEYCEGFRKLEAEEKRLEQRLLEWFSAKISC